MAGISNYLEAALLNHVLRNITYTPSFQIFLALHTANPTDAGTGAEVSAGGYARQELSFGAPSSGASQNTTTATFANMPTTNVTHIALWDDGSAGNLLFHGELSSPISFNSGDEATVGVGAISVELD